MKTYLQTRKCSTCGNEESRNLSLGDAAFEETRVWIEPCGKCGSVRFSSVGCPLPDMNRELFELWIHDNGLTVLSQDEDLVIGTGENLILLEEFLQREDALPEKRAVLLSAICVILYDNTPDPDNPDVSRNPEFAALATAILKRNLRVFDEINELYISNYIKQVVYPIIGRPLPTET
jgi:hypothetical protein